MNTLSESIGYALTAKRYALKKETGFFVKSEKACFVMPNRFASLISQTLQLGVLERAVY